MLVEVKIKVITRFLGNVRHADGIYRFPKDKKTHQILLDLPLWMWAIKTIIQSSEECLAEICASCIRFPLSIKAPKLVLFADKRGKMYEAVDKGAVLTFDVVLADEPPPYNSQGKRGPTPEELKLILNRSGTQIGFSSSKGDTGLGRFVVLAVTEKKICDSSLSTTTAA